MSEAIPWHLGHRTYPFLLIRMSFGSASEYDLASSNRVSVLLVGVLVVGGILLQNIYSE